MSDTSLRNDNSTALAATVHQLYLALEACFKMDRTDQCVIIEKLGDFTVLNSNNDGVGTEVKSYDKENELTDSHANWWNTLRNWLQEDQQLNTLSSLVLYTTQPISESSLLTRWNDSTAEQRVAILKKIHSAAEDRHTTRVAKDSAAKVPNSLSDMRFALSDGQKLKLAEVVQKVVICADMPGLAECRDRLILGHAKGIPPEGQPQFIGALFEFIVRPSTIEKKWTINYREFADEVCRFTKYFGGGRRAFPTKARRNLTEDECGHHNDSQFVAKIVEIEFQKKVPQAIADYLYATQTWMTEFSSHKTIRADYEVFVSDLRTSFSNQHEQASMQCTDVLKDSQRFYLGTMGAQNVPQFPNLETPNLAYRNGVLHVLMDEEPVLRWRLNS